jgi:hypothetical protein
MVPAFKKLRLASGAFIDLTIPAFKETLPAKATLFEVGFDERVRCSETKTPSIKAFHQLNRYFAILAAQAESSYFQCLRNIENMRPAGFEIPTA